MGLIKRRPLRFHEDRPNRALLRPLPVEYDDYDASTVSGEMVQAVIDHLAIAVKTHRVVIDKPGVVLLERVTRETIPMPPFTFGFGWLGNVWFLKA